MKIDKPSLPTPLDAVSGDRSTAARSKASSPTATPVASADSVSLSDRSLTLQRLGSEAVEPSFDAAKVAEIKSAIANGTFKVDAGKVADALIGSVKDMLSKKPGA